MASTSLAAELTSASFTDSFGEKLSACGDPMAAPAQMAELFRLVITGAEEAAAVRNILQAELLRWTIHKAVSNIKFYQCGVYAEALTGDPGTGPMLEGLPVLQRTDVVRHLDELRNNFLTFESISQTTGCTGVPLSVYKSAEELSFLWAYQTQLMKPIRGKLASYPLVLSLPNLYHGNPLRVPSIGKPFVAGVTDDLLLSNIITMLRQHFKIPGYDSHFSIINSLVHQIIFFTNYLLEKEIDPKQFNIQSINVVGGYVSRYARQFLQEHWGAVIFDRFSLTESAGGATRCHRCGYFHLDPHVIGEVLEPATNRPIEEGIGRLVITDLYPFVQMQPFIRYDTGDIVRRVQNACNSGLTFEFAGKSGNCIKRFYKGKVEWLVLSVDLLEILDGIPDFRRVEQFRGVHSAGDPSIGSLPVYSLESSIPDDGVAEIRLTLELRYSPPFYYERTAELKEIIGNGLSNANPLFGKRIREKEVELRICFVGPGTLKDNNMLKI